MSRGKSRNRYRTNSSQNIGCFETVYDGVDDRRYSTDATLKAGGKLTLCTEIYFVGNDPARCSGNVTSTGYIFPYMNAGNARFFVPGGEVVYTGGVSAMQGKWCKAVFTITDAKREVFVDIDDGNGLVSRATNTTAITFESGTFSDFTFGATGNTEFASVRLRNYQIYTGEATNGASWIPENTTALSGVSLLLESKDGGSTIDTGQTFVTGGDPITQACT